MKKRSKENTMSNTNSKGTKAFLVTGVAALTVSGIFVIPPILKKYRDKIYKASVKNDKIDLDNLGPEIVRKEGSETEEQ